MEKEQRAIWTAGYVEVLGIFTVAAGSVRLILKTRRNKEALQKLADAWDLNAGVEGKGGIDLRVGLAGAPLHKFMKELWPHLTAHRRREYKKMVLRASSSK